MERVQVPDGAEEAELVRLMETYGPQLTRLCTALIGDADLSQDLVQETFLRAYKGLKAYRGGREKERVWLSRIAVNLCRDWGRSRWNRYVDRRVPVENLPEPAVPAEEKDWRLLAAVEALPGDLREVIVLAYQQNLDTLDIARVLGIPRTTVYRRLKRAYRQLKETLEADEDDE